ncbi:MAG TPA: hypothetical protein DCZ94_03615 [Lentisphaeria bacterium]|nr:MAG: hypothetical protein A2X48_02240 [Lentisphaerae bacterium GWF2_49_21]HBC86021.1 hypothetical protein [Lentisphaeria bacterium]
MPDKVTSASYRIALAAGLFSLAVLFLLLLNFQEMSWNDPLSSANAAKINGLTAKHRLEPDNESIKKEIQVLDQQTRQYYFNSVRKARTGSYLLVAGLVIFIISLKIHLGNSSARSRKSDK